MVAKTKTAPASRPKASAAKVAKKVTKSTATEDEGKARGRQRDTKLEANILKQLLPNVTIDGEGVTARVTNLSEAIQEVDLPEGKSLDSNRAKMIILRHLADEAGDSRKATPASIAKARDNEMLSWAQIDAVFGTSRSESLKLYGEHHGDPNAWRERHLYGEGGLRPKAEKPAKSTKAKVKKAGTPIFDEDVTKEDVLAKVKVGKVIHWNLSERVGGGQSNAKVASNLKVGVSKKTGSLSIAFNDGDKSRTVNVADITKVGR